MTNKPKTMWLIIAVLISAIITFSITYYVFNQQKNSVQSQIITLENEKKELSSNLAALQVANAKDKTYISLLTDYDLYQIKYFEDINVVQESFDKINMTLDYTTCKAGVDKLREIHRMFNTDEQKTLDYLQKISDFANKSSCLTQVNEYADAQKVVVDSRKKYTDAYENWCYGWHKVEYSSTWTEEYSTPSTQAYDKVFESEEKIGNIYSKAIETCLTD